MSIKTLLIILIFSISVVYEQNANSAANKPATSAKINPTPTPMPSNTTIRGNVFFEDDGKPLRRSTVVFFRTGSGRELQTLTDENGNFELKNTQAGSYFPMVLSAGIVNFFSSIDFQNIENADGERGAFKDAMKGFQEIVADGKTNIEVNIPIKRGGSVSGNVTYSDGSPAAGRSIQILRKINGKFQPVISNFSCLAIVGVGSGVCNETDDRGWYRFLGLPAGEYFIRVNEPAVHGNNSLLFGGPDMAFSMMFGFGAFLNTYYPNTIEAAQAKPIKVELRKEQKDVNITIPDWKLYKISGKLVSEKDGKPVRAKIYIQKNDLMSNITPPNFNQSRSFIETDNDGNWSFNEIPRGDYTLLVEPYSNERVNFMSAVNAAANAANMAANAVRSASNVSNRAYPRVSPTPDLPKDYSNTSKNLTVESSNLESIEIKVNTSAWVFGTVVIPPKTDSEGSLKITVFDENDVSIKSDYIYLYDIKENSANSIKTFELKGLPKGRIKLKFEMSNSNLFVKSAMANGIDLLNNFIELKAGQVLSNVRIVLEKKQ